MKVYQKISVLLLVLALTLSLAARGARQDNAGGGTILEEGTPEDFFTRPQLISHNYSRPRPDGSNRPQSYCPGIR